MLIVTEKNTRIRDFFFVVDVIECDEVDECHQKTISMFNFRNSSLVLSDIVRLKHASVSDTSGIAAFQRGKTTVCFFFVHVRNYSK